MWGGSRPRRVALAGLVALGLAAGLPAVLAAEPVAAPAALASSDVPDPFVLTTDGQYYAFATNNLGNVPVRRSADLTAWGAATEALPVLGRWAVPGRTWAPAVLARWPVYVLFYTAQDRHTGLQCVGRAVSRLPQGPYVDLWDLPIVCQVHRGGSIDASPFVDGWTPYLYWKSEGVPAARGAEPPRLWVQQLSDDGLHLVGRGVELARADRAWEGGVVEAPSMVREAGRYVLLYSGNRWDTSAYAVGWASCRSAVGPCTKAAGPLLRSGARGLGPGGQEAFRDLGGRLWLAYHAWGGHVGYPRGARTMRLQPLAVRDGVPVVGG